MDDKKTQQEKSMWDTPEINWKYHHDYVNAGNNRMTDEVLGFQTILKLLEQHPRFKIERNFPTQGRVHQNTVLDFGCGEGDFTYSIASDCKTNVMAVDPSENSIRKAETNCRSFGDNPHYRHARMNCAKNYVRCRKIQDSDISFIEGESLDAAFVNFVLCTIKDDNLVRKILQQIHEKLKPCAPFFVCDCHPTSLGKDFYSFRKEKPENLVEGSPINTWLTGMTFPVIDYWRSEQKYLELLEQGGFKRDRIKVHTSILKDREDEEYWRDERKSPPLIIFEAVK
jgi:SAM-dependent methyltransferase